MVRSLAMLRAALPVALLALGLLACSEGLSSKEQKIIDEAMASLEQAPPEIRNDVMRTCGKWMHSRRACDEQTVRLHQMECWLEAGLPHLKSALKKNLRFLARDRKTLQHQSVCMEKRGWRIRNPGEKY